MASEEKNTQSSYRTSAVYTELQDDCPQAPQAEASALGEP